MGIDHNADYIATAARLNRGTPATFLVADVTDPVVKTHGPYNLVMLSGVLHHPKDDIVEQLAQNVAP